MANILVVEDEEPIRHLVQILLQGAGHQADQAASGPEALKRLSEQPYDLVVLDLMLGRISGWQVLRQMEQWNLRTRTKVLILTARASERDILHGWRMGVDAYVTKPFDPDVFMEAVRDTLQRTPEELAVRREDELHKSELLYRVQLAFGEAR
jgi:two-component system, OmpR family, phosphate regulon response regulator PhoB